MSPVSRITKTSRIRNPMPLLSLGFLFLENYRVTFCLKGFVGFVPFFSARSPMVIPRRFRMVFTFSLVDRPIKSSLLLLDILHSNRSIVNEKYKYSRQNFILLSISDTMKCIIYLQGWEKQHAPPNKESEVTSFIPLDFHWIIHYICIMW